MSYGDMSEMFQFQIGAIKSAKINEVKYVELFGFNSKLVRLKGRSHISSSACSSSFNSKLVRLKESYPIL